VPPVQIERVEVVNDRRSNGQLWEESESPAMSMGKLTPIEKAALEAAAAILTRLCKSNTGGYASATQRRRPYLFRSALVTRQCHLPLPRAKSSRPVGCKPSRDRWQSAAMYPWSGASRAPVATQGGSRACAASTDATGVV